MSLSPEQKKNTIRELNENFEKSGLTVKQIACDLGTSEKYIGELFALRPKRLEDTWILKNYLIEKVTANCKAPTEFTALVGDHHGYWFLDGGYIDRGKMG